MGANRGQLRDLACTREEQTGTQLSEEARREQNSSSLSLSQSISPSLHPPLLCQKSEAQHNFLTRHGDLSPEWRAGTAQGAHLQRRGGYGRGEGTTERTADG